jgi:hypothetical protein
VLRGFAVISSGSEKSHSVFRYLRSNLNTLAYPSNPLRAKAHLHLRRGRII